jgi:large subunit ribosomal protein L6
MSRIGKMPVDLPKGVDVKVNGQKVEIKGPKGQLSREIHPAIEIKLEDGKLSVTPREQGQKVNALWGLARSLLNNMVQGVNAGFSKTLEINGVGYRAEIKGKTLNMNLGFSHPVEFALPEGITAAVDKNTVVTISGIDKELVGQTAATIRAYRPPEPYKGKGIKYSDEVIIRKVGKAGVK